MRVVIAGGSGLIGHALTRELINAGYEIMILSRNPEKVIGFPTTVKALRWDGKTIQNWAENIENCDAVINLSGENLSGESFLPSRWTKKRKERLINSRLYSGNVLTKAVERMKTKPKVFVQASGISYYGTDKKKQFTETSDGGTDFLANLSKEWEASSKLVESMGVRRVIIRSGIVLSAISGALPRLLLPYKLFVGGPLGNGKQFYSWIHLEDEVNAIKFLIENNVAEGVYNLTSPSPISNNDFGKEIAKALKRPHYFPIPGLLMHLAFGEVATVVLEGQKVYPSKLLEHGYIFKYPELGEALRNILQNPK